MVAAVFQINQDRCPGDKDRHDGAGGRELRTARSSGGKGG